MDSEHDQLTSRMRRDTLLDKFIHYGKLPIRELAELLNIAPQLIYYRVRNHKLSKVTCEHCGAEGFIDLKEARGEFPKLEEAVQEEEEIRRSQLET